MSEHEQNQNQNPEKKKPAAMYDDCSRCETRYKITPDNSALYLYTKQPECTFLYCVCPKCDFRTRIFVGKETVQLSVDTGLRIIAEDYAGENVYSDWIELKGIELPRTYELTNRHEALIQKFGEALLSMPDQMLYEGFHDETDNPYPQKWID